MKGLAKVAFDHTKDPAWQALEQERLQKHKDYENARAQRNPELLKKEETALAIGLLGGAGLGTLAGGAIGGKIGTEVGDTLAQKIVFGGGGGALGGYAGGVTGLLGGGLASLPFAKHYERQDNPEAVRNYHLTSGSLADAEDHQSDYQQFMKERNRNK